MLASFPAGLGAALTSVQRNNTSVSTITHTSPATAHTYGTPTQLIASTPWPTVGINLRLNGATGVSGGRSDTIVQLMIGGAGSETDLVTVACGFSPAGRTIALPLYIPEGSRISVRHKSHRTSFGLGYTLDLFGGPTVDHAGLPTRWVSYGLVDDASNSRGTAVTAGNSNAWGSWTALTTSTTYPHSLWVPVVDGGTADTTTALNYRSQFAVASTSDAATEVTNSTVWDGPRWATTTAEQMTNQASPYGAFVLGSSAFSESGIIYAPRPEGAAVSMRAMCSGTAETACAGSILAAVM